MTLHADKINLIEILNPLDPGQASRSSIEHRPGKSLEDLFPSLVLKADFVFSVNGRIVDDKAATYPQPGDSVVMCPVLAGGGGGGGGKTVLRLVAMIAISFIATPAAGALYSAAGGTFVAAGAGATISMIAAGITIAGGMLVNAMIPAPKAGADGTAGSGMADTPTYGVDGPKNASAEGIVVPVVYGTHRFGGNLINAYTVNDGDSQFLHLLFNCGEGPVASITDVLINDQTTDKYADVLVETRLGYGDQPLIGLFAQQIIPRSIGLELTTDWRYKTTEGTVDQLRYDLVAPNGLYGVDAKTGDSFPTAVVLEVQYRRVGTTAWLGMQGTASVGGYGKGAQWNQVQRFPGLGSEEMVQYAPTGREVLSGNVYYGPVGSGYDGVEVGIVVDVPVYVDSFEMAGNKRTALRRSFLTPTLPQGRYETRVRRTAAAAVTANGAKTVLINNIVWSDLNEVVHDPVAYKHTALLGIRVRMNDQLNGLPTVTHLNGGKLVRVWNAKTGNWDFKSSANPAWISLDAMTNKRYGAGMSQSRFYLQKWIEWGAHCDQNGLEFNGVFDAQSNVWDAMDPVFRCGHAGRTNVGTRYSVTIDRPQAPRMMFSVGNMITGTFKQNWLPSADRINEIEATFIDREDDYKQKTLRIVDKVAAASGRPARSTSLNFSGLTSMAEVWRDANILLNHNRLLLQTVEWSSPLEAIGCSVGDVVTVQHDMPRWSLAGRLEAGSTASIVMLDRPVVMEPGVAYSVLLHLGAVRRHAGTVSQRLGSSIFIGGFGGASNVKRAKINGRDLAISSVVQQGSSFGVILDNADGIAAGQAIELWDTDALETRPVSNPSTVAGQEHTTLTLSAALPQVPEQYTNWMFGRVNRVGKPFTIRSIKGTHEYRRDITAIEYQDGAFLTTPAPEATNFSDLPLSVPHAEITGVDDEVFLIGTVTKSRVTVEYRGVDDAYARSRVYLSRNGGPEELVGTDPYQVTVEASLGDPLVFRVVAGDMFQRWAPRSTAPTRAHIAKGRTTAPGDATGLNATVSTIGWNVVWDEPLDPDVTASELRIGATWETGRRLFRGKANNCVIPFMKTGDNQLRLRHCIGGTDGLYSGKDAVKTITVMAPLQPIITAEVERRIISMAWQVCTQTQPLQGYEIQRGPNVNELTAIGFEEIPRFQYSEPKPAKHLYWVTAVDAAGNRGAAGYREIETFLEIDEYMDILQAELDERVAELLKINAGQDQALVTEINNRATDITAVKKLITDGDVQVASRIDTVAAKATGYSRGNLLFNGGFEFLLQGWRSGGAGTLSIKTDSWGAYLSLVGSGATGGLLTGGTGIAPIAAVPGVWYNFAADTRFVSTTGVCALGLAFYNAAGALVPIVSKTGGANLGNHDFSNESDRRPARAIEAMAPAGAVTVVAALDWSGFSGTGEIAIRQAKIERGRLPATPYSSEASDIGALAAIRNEITARADGDRSEAAAREQVVSTLNGKIATVTTESQTYVDKATGTLGAKWGVSVDAGGNVAGVQLLNDGKKSSFIILVDKFAVALPTGAGIKYPFVVGSVNGTPTVGIDGNLVVDGTILTRALQAESITADKIKTKSLTATQIMAGAITADLINVGLGTNLIPNATLMERPGSRGMPTGWGYSSSVTIAAMNFGTQYNPTYSLVDGVTGFIEQTNADYNGHPFYDRNSQQFSPIFSVTPGTRYEFQARLVAHRCMATVMILFMDFAGNWLATTAPAPANQPGGNAAALADYAKVGGFAVAPANAARARVLIIKGATAPGAVSSYLFWTEPFAAVATASQTVLSAYTPSGLGTKITPEGITTPSLSALTGNMGTLSAGQLDITGDVIGGNGWGWVRSPGKWLDQNHGWIMARNAVGEMFVDFTIGGMRFAMHKSTTKDTASMDWGSIAMDNEGNLTVRKLDVIDTLNLRGQAVTATAIASASNDVQSNGGGVGRLVIGNYTPKGYSIFVRLTCVGMGSAVDSGGGGGDGF